MPKIETNVRIKYLKASEIHVFIGYITVKSNEGKYLYSKFSNITRLTREDALWDADNLKRELSPRE